MGKKNKKGLIQMNSKESPYFYVTKNSSDQKLKLRRFDPYLRKHVLFTQGKVKK